MNATLGLCKNLGRDDDLYRKSVTLICSAFNVSEHWLSTGEGEMFHDSPHEREFQELFSSLMTKLSGP